MDTSASIIKAMLPEAAQKLVGDSDARASDRPQTADGNADRMTGGSAGAILYESPRVCRAYGRWLGGAIVVVALLVSGRGRGKLLLGVSIGWLGALKYFGFF